MSQADTETEILNIALIMLGAAPVLSINDDVKAAREGLRLWNPVRDAEFSAHQWNFTTKRALLPAKDETPAWGYKFVYQVPSDLICLIEVGDRYPGVRLDDYKTHMPMADYRHEGDTIVTNFRAPLKIRYTARIEAVGLWDPAFKMAFACQMALQLCESLTQSNTKQGTAAAKYKEAIFRAIATNAVENPPDPLPDDTWLLSRFYR